MKFREFERIERGSVIYHYSIGIKFYIVDEVCKNENVVVLYTIDSGEKVSVVIDLVLRDYYVPESIEYAIRDIKLRSKKALSKHQALESYLASLGRDR